MASHSKATQANTNLNKVVSPAPTVEEILQATLTASSELRAEALRVLRGEFGAVETRQFTATEPYLTLTSLSKVLGVSPSTLWRWQPPFHDLGGTKRYRLSEVQQYLESPGFHRRSAALRAERRKPTVENDGRKDVGPHEVSGSTIEALPGGCENE